LYIILNQNEEIVKIENVVSNAFEMIENRDFAKKEHCAQFPILFYVPTFK